MELYTLDQAADFLGMHKETLRRRAVDGSLPGAKPGKSWRFLRDDLVSYLRSLYSDSASQGVTHRSKTQWHSTKEETSIGLISATMESEYKEALGLQTASKR